MQQIEHMEMEMRIGSPYIQMLMLPARCALVKATADTKADVEERRWENAWGLGMCWICW